MPRERHGQRKNCTCGDVISTAQFTTALGAICSAGLLDTHNPRYLLVCCGVSCHTLRGFADHRHAVVRRGAIWITDGGPVDDNFAVMTVSLPDSVEHVLRLWRAFPCDPAAPEGDPFSPSYITPKQDSGRFDLSGQPLVLNLAESPGHAVAEQIQEHHGQMLEPADLTENGERLAVVEVTIAGGSLSIADLCEPRELIRYGCRPDELMSRNVACTQSLSRRLYEAGLAGFRVWSALTGDWRCTVLFTDRIPKNSIAFGEPTMLTLDHPAVAEAAEVLEIRLPADEVRS